VAVEVALQHQVVLVEVATLQQAPMELQTLAAVALLEILALLEMGQVAVQVE
jgi:hypothetical protein